MLKLRSLNRESSSDDDAPAIRREAQEEIVLDLYNKALRLQRNNELTEAEIIIKQLIKENIPQLESEGGLPKTMSTLKFSCYTNLGSISMRKGETKEALDNYLLASELDKKDVTLWYKIGKLAIKLDQFKQGAFAFYMGLECSEYHWPCLDELISVLFALRDTIACLKYIGKALILDPSYLKGLVLRRQIYEFNTATKEYYQLFNPDYIYEPDLAVNIDESDEKQILEEAELLCDRINEAEKSVAPKGLPTIPLPIPLEEFTWLSLGKTIIELHKYITNNNMSHFCFVDLKRCMSSKLETEESNTMKMEVNDNVQSEVDVIQKVENSEINVVVNENNDLSEKFDSSQLERRMSQFSENDTTEQENKTTPIQTDNDEIEQDIEEQLDQEENTDSSKLDKSKNQNRSIKRKRDLVSDLQIWGWHSKRKSAKRGKTEKDFRIEDAFMRIIPSQLRPNDSTNNQFNLSEDSMNTIYICQMNNEEKSLLSPIHSPGPNFNFNNLKYFGTETEKSDVQQFWTQTRTSCNAVNLIEEYVYKLCNMWKYKWPEALPEIYIQAYQMFREHFDHPHIFCDDLDFDNIKRDAFVTLLYGEFVTYNTKRSDESKNNDIHISSIAQLELASRLNDNFGEEYFEFFIRLQWLRTHFYKKEMQNVLSISALQMMQEFILFEESKTETPYKLVLKNCNRYGRINLVIIERLLKNLEMVDSLSRLLELYEKQQYTEVAEVLKSTFKSNNRATCKKLTRPAQLAMLLHSLWFTDFSECFIWAEECLYEAMDYFIKPKEEDAKWTAVTEKCLLIMQEIIKSETVNIVDCLVEDKRCRLVDTLCKICCKQVNAEHASKIPLGSTIPWLLLHYILLRQEHRQQAQRKVKKVKKEDSNTDKSIDDSLIESSLPPSIAILFSAHEFLGPKGWCLTNQGELLHFIIDSILDRLDTPIFEEFREKIDIHLEQAFFCLYQHPSKRNKVSRHLADHNVNPLPLTWERAQQVYEFFCPDSLPEFDSYKSISISSEFEQLLQRISALVPTECDPQPLLPKVTDFVNGNTNTLPMPVSFPIKTRSIYYLLGDFYFKQSDIKRSVKYFLLDLCILPQRLDTWACMALGIASQLEHKLTHCERFKNEMEFLDKAKSAQVCFKEALKLSTNHVTLWIEFGSFEYMVHSFCSRVLKYESETLSMEKFEVLEYKKDDYLKCSKECFMKALSLYEPEQSEPDERWLHHYMLAKISEKNQQEPTEYLEHYYAATTQLQENSATYPDKINYNNPQHLALEALEVYYRINASILKYLELHEGKPITSILGKTFKKYLDLVTLSKPSQKLHHHQPPQQQQQTKYDSEAINSEDQKIEEQITADVQNCMGDLLSKVINDEVKSKDVKNDSSTKDFITISDSDDEKQESKIASEVEKEEASLNESSVNVLPETNDTENKINVEQTINESMEVIQEHNYTDKSETVKEATEDSTTSSSTSSDSSSSDSDSESSSSSSSTNSSDNTTGHLSESEISSLVDRCISGLEECMRRLPQNYKALYRLAHLYFHYNHKKDLYKAKQLMLGEYKCKNGIVINGLFSDRKISNFFNGIWRIPSSEIDRPGSLSAHMGRCVNLLLQVLRNTNDHKTLLDLCLQLRRIPDADKVYIRHSEREQLSEQALSLCIQTLRTAIKNVSDTAATEKLMIDIFKAYQRSQKNLAHKESVFSNMLTDIYKKFLNDKIPENANILDLAVKYCQQNRAAEKLKKQQTVAALPKATILTTSPVLPAPSGVNALPTLKRPSLGRPRGRPPGPKLLSQARSPRGRPPGSTTMNSFGTSSMVDQTAIYEYLRKCQEELIMQYSKTLNLQQMAQLAQLGQNQFLSNSLKQGTSQNQFQNTQLLHSIQQLGLLNPQLLNASLNLPNLNSSLLKKSVEQQSLSTSNTSSIPTSNFEHLKQLSSIAQTTGSNFSKKPSHTNSLLKSNNVTKMNAVPNNPTKLPQTTSVFNAPYKSQTVANYSTADISSGKFKPSTATTSSYQSTYAPSKTIKDHSSNLFLKERPNLSITPVTQQANVLPSVSNSANPSISVSPGKTLQEKLADKQKQNMNKSANRKIDFYSAPPLTIPTTLPNFPKESSLSISQIQLNPKAVESTAFLKKDSPSVTSKSKILNTHPNVPLSLSVIKKVDEKPKITDDVIIIE